MYSFDIHAYLHAELVSDLYDFAFKPLRFVSENGLINQEHLSDGQEGFS